MNRSSAQSLIDQLLSSYEYRWSIDSDYLEIRDKVINELSKDDKKEDEIVDFCERHHSSKKP